MMLDSNSGKRMETTIVSWGVRESGKENGNH